jgi:hypothetical protein
MMKGQRHVFMGVLVALLLVVVHPGGAQMKGKMTTADILAALKPGQWAQLEGIIRPDRSIQCTEVKLLTGERLDNDWSIAGLTGKVNQEKQEVEIFRLPVKVQPDTVFKEKIGTFKSFADVKPKIMVKAEGTYLQDGTFLARQLKNVPPEPAGKPDEEPDKVIEAVGKVEKIDPTTRRVTLMGMTFQLTQKTKGESVVR